MPDTDTLSPEDIRVGATIRALREPRGLTSDELGRAVGVTGGMIRHIERGQRHASLKTCTDIARILHVSVAAITVEGYDDIAAARS